MTIFSGKQQLSVASFLCATVFVPPQNYTSEISNYRSWNVLFIFSNATSKTLSLSPENASFSVLVLKNFVNQKHQFFDCHAWSSFPNKCHFLKTPFPDDSKSELKATWTIPNDSISNNMYTRTSSFCSSQTNTIEYCWILKTKNENWYTPYISVRIHTQHNLDLSNKQNTRQAVENQFCASNDVYQVFHHITPNGSHGWYTSVCF